MAKIVGVDGMTVGQVTEGIRAGGRFVVFEYCISIVLLTFRRSSNIHYVPPGRSTAAMSLPYTMISILLGWWGVPWGFIYTPMVLATNFGGGKDVTAAVMSSMRT